MPENSLDPVVASQVSNTIDQATQYIAASKMSRQARKYNEKMYERQRSDALSDWETQNLYNSPIEQMKRYRDAGLNPNLIYGQMNEAQPVRSSQAPGWNPATPQTPKMSQMYDLKLKEAMLENAKEAISVTRAEASLKAAQEEAIRRNLPMQGYGEAMSLPNVENKNLNNRTLSQNLGISAQANERAQAEADQRAVMHTYSVEAAVKSLIRQRLENERLYDLKEDDKIRYKILLEELKDRQYQNKFNEWEKKLNDLNMTRTDDIKWRVGKKVLDEIITIKPETKKEAKKNAQDYINKFPTIPGY